MAVLRQIAQIGNPVLRRICDLVSDHSNYEIRALIDDMSVTVEDAGGVGIAAPQVYESLRVIIVASRPSQRYPDAPVMKPIPVINPEIIWKSENDILGWEGCLSVPGLRGIVPRSERIAVKYMDMEGKIVEEEYFDFPARIFQHEMDHLNGVMFIDRVKDLRDLASEKEYLKNLK